MSGNNYKKLVSSIKYFIDVVQPKIEAAYRTKMAENNDACGVLITYSEPTPIGERYEILLKTFNDASTYITRHKGKDAHEIISLEDAIKLSRSEHCAGGPITLAEAKDIWEQNNQIAPQIKAQDFVIH